LKVSEVTIWLGSIMLLNADRPIEDVSEDALGVRDFAHALADSILRMTPSNGFVIALPGEWGSGKSSILNLVERRINHQEMASWTLSGAYREDGTLAPLRVEDIEARAQIFRRVIDTARSFIDSHTDRLLVRKPQRLQSFQADGLSLEEALAAEDYLFIREEVRSNPRTIVLRFNPWWFSGQENLFRAFFAELAALLPEAAGHRLKQSMRAFAARFAGIGSVAASAASTIMPVPGVKETGNLIETLLRRWGEKDKGLGRSKTELASALRQREHKVLVIIDDIDRLLPFEAFQIFSLIKSVGDLPNVVYLLAYEQKRITSMLSDAPLRVDPEFLEKIIQYEAPVPIPDPAGLPALLDKSLNAVLPPIPESKRDELNKRIGLAYYYVLRGYLSQPRDVSRLSNALQVAMANLAGQVDACDFIVLETLRLFDNQAYLAIRDDLGWLTGEEPGWGRDKEIAAALKSKLAKCRNVQIAERAIGALFPRASNELKLYVGQHKGQAEDAGDRRLCVPQYARAYFSLVPLPHLFRSEEIDALFRSSEPEPQLQRMLQKARSERGPKGLSRIPTFIVQLSDQLAAQGSMSRVLARAVFDQSEELIRVGDEDPDMYGSDNARRLSSLMMRWVRSVDENDRYDSLKPIAQSTPGITLAAIVIWALGPDKRQIGASRDEALLPNEQLESIRIILLSRIREMAKGGSIWNIADPSRMIWTWWGIGEEDEAKTWLANEISEGRNLFRLMAAMPDLVRSTEGNYLAVNREGWERLVDIEAVAGRAEQRLAADTISDLDKQIARRFLAAIERGRRR
jgi:KAP family P-loop domain